MDFEYEAIFATIRSRGCVGDARKVTVNQRESSLDVRQTGMENHLLVWNIDRPAAFRPGMDHPSVCVCA
jgi:hypothetical protein